ncbi:MAG TPA: hypothetical protein VFP66_16145 [Candidatus Limnocylindrales bacterium]|nr:hypothetical protein [Candidatus Limnocylindrales bacterium]
MRQAKTMVAPRRIDLTRRLLLVDAIDGARRRLSMTAVVCTLLALRWRPFLERKEHAEARPVKAPGRQCGHLL